MRGKIIISRSMMEQHHKTCVKQNCSTCRLRINLNPQIKKQIPTTNLNDCPLMHMRTPILNP